MSQYVLKKSRQDLLTVQIQNKENYEGDTQGFWPEHLKTSQYHYLNQVRWEGLGLEGGRGRGGKLSFISHRTRTLVSQQTLEGKL